MCKLVRPFWIRFDGKWYSVPFAIQEQDLLQPTNFMSRVLAVVALVLGAAGVARPFRPTDLSIQAVPQTADPTLADAERSWVRGCPCEQWHANEIDANRLCLPLARTAAATRALAIRKEVFVFSITSDDRWKHYDWDTVTTVAWNTDKELVCHAHKKDVRVVVKHNFDAVDQLCNLTARREWIQATYELIETNYADGVNIDTEQPMNGKPAECLAELVRELRNELQRHPLTQYAQITFDVPWAPRGVDGRYYPWKELADASDFLFVMAYDMRSQIYDACIAGANSPRALVQQGIDEFLVTHGVPADKLVLGLPWYGYEYECQSTGLETGGGGDAPVVCPIPAIPFFGAPCSDAAGRQLDFAVIDQLVHSEDLTVQWDEMSESPFVWRRRHTDTGLSIRSPTLTQLWFDNVTSLEHKFQLVRAVGLRGAGVWHADALNYSAPVATAANNATQRMWQALKSAVATPHE